jgi:DNA-binding transcriptional MerR regulator
MTPAGAYHLNGKTPPDGAGPDLGPDGPSGMSDAPEHVEVPEVRTGGEAAGGEFAGDAARSRPKKAPNAFRTISEVADELHIPQHVLRFWESKFPQVKPLKRGGGRRYYRPDDILLLRRISDLLYIQGYTIKGVQRLLREGGGRLSEDIPPATPDEQAEAAAEREAVIAADEPQLPMPGLDPVAAPRVSDESEARTQRITMQAEVQRLRDTLAHVLQELEAVRALLP